MACNPINPLCIPGQVSITPSHGSIGEPAMIYHGPSRDRAAELDKLIEGARPILGEHKVRLLRFQAGLPHQAAL